MEMQAMMMGELIEHPFVILAVGFLIGWCLSMVEWKR